MTFKHFLSDQKWLLFTFYFILLLVTILVSVDPKLQITIGTLVYLLILSIFIFNVYFIGTYFYKKNQLETWLSFTHDCFRSFPEAKNHEQTIYLQSLQLLRDAYSMEIYEMNEATKGQLEFMTQWFHEIKTPIAICRLLVETEIDSPSLQEEINRIEGYVEQALYFSRLHEFNKDYVIQEIDLEKLIKEIIISESKTFIAKKVKIELPKINMVCVSDKKALSYIIRQLLLNALKYSKEHGVISISLNQMTKQIIIRDNGIGIPAEDLPRVFEKGFTGKNGRNIQRSTGMGLFLAKKTAEKLGHELTVYSKEGIYTEAVLTLTETNDKYHIT